MTFYLAFMYKIIIKLKIFFLYFFSQNQIYIYVTLSKLCPISLLDIQFVCEIMNTALDLHLMLKNVKEILVCMSKTNRSYTEAVPSFEI